MIIQGARNDLSHMFSENHFYILNSNHLKSRSINFNDCLVNIHDYNSILYQVEMSLDNVSVNEMFLKRLHTLKYSTHKRSKILYFLIICFDFFLEIVHLQHGYRGKLCTINWYS